MIRITAEEARRLREQAADWRARNAERARQKRPGAFPDTAGGWVLFFEGKLSDEWVGELRPEKWIPGTVAAPAVGSLMIAEGGNTTDGADRFVALTVEEEKANIQHPTSNIQHPIQEAQPTCRP